jgi:arylsulfatase A
MPARLFARFVCLVACGLLFIGATTGGNTSALAADKPNVVLVLVDDMGWTDLGCYGSTFYETPHIDRLAASGMRFTDGYAACTVCSPTRAAVLTGRYPARLHITDWIAGHQRPFAKLLPPDWTKYLPHEETTIAEIFQAAGYATCHVGKWHLGNEPYWPRAHGFDHNIGGNHRGQPPSYFFPYERNDIKLPGLAEGDADEYLTDRLTDESIRFIQANKDRPFFLYLPHYTVHTPLQAKRTHIAKYEAKADPDQPQHNATYAAMIESLDEGMGRLLDCLDELELREKTIVVFTSDNGGLVLNQVTSNVPLRAGKGSAYEGGVRVPLMFSYPPLIAAGTTSDVPAMSIDLLPTLVELCDLTVPEERPKWDGVSLAAALKQQGEVERDALYWHYPHYHPGGATPYAAVRAGDWRLLEFYEDGRTELFNLKDEIGETSDLAAARHEKRDELLTMLRTWRADVGAQMPRANPDYDPDRAAQPAAKAKAKGKKKAAP